MLRVYPGTQSTTVPGNAPLDSHPQPETPAEKRAIAAHCVVCTLTRISSKNVVRPSVFSGISHAGPVLTSVKPRTISRVFRQSPQRLFGRLANASCVISAVTRSPLVGFVDSDYDVYSNAMYLWTCLLRLRLSCTFRLV